ncbi:MAG: CapA family protein [Anaerolineales bacterium]
MRTKGGRLFSLVLSAVLYVSCVPAWGSGMTESPPTVDTPPAIALSSPTPFLPEGSLPLPTPTPVASPIPPPASPTPLVSNAPLRLWVEAAVPPTLRAAVSATGLPLAASEADATLRYGLYTPQVSIPDTWTVWVYALVAPFPTVEDGVSAADLRRAWAEEPTGLFGGRPLLMDESTLAAFSAHWGPPAADAVRVVQSAHLLDEAWAARPSWAIIPFEDLEPRWKVLTIDGQSPIRRGFNPATYPLTLTFALQASPGVSVSFSPPLTNLDPSKMTTLVMTGVTALVRATAYRMERYGSLYPAADIRDDLRSADITHISNEVPFAENCPYPDPASTFLIFCSNPDYIALLEDVGADVIELTGNHFQDYGSEATLMTLDMYAARGWSYFGGGRDLADSQQPALLEHNGNRFAFIGCNPVGPAFAWATDTRPGAAPCGDYGWMTAAISQLRADGYQVIVTMQYWEYYVAAPPSNQERDFARLAQAGAVIVSGSQSHFPQAFAFEGDSFVHYGLGNLFFDQMDTPVAGTRREFVDRHVFYNGRHISTEVLTYMLEDYARPRPMTPAERADLLQEIFLASGW